MQHRSLRKRSDFAFQPIVKYLRPHAHIVGQPLGAGFGFQGELNCIPNLLCSFIIQNDPLTADQCLAIEGDI